MKREKVPGKMALREEGWTYWLRFEEKLAARAGGESELVRIPRRLGVPITAISELNLFGWGSS